MGIACSGGGAAHGWTVGEGTSGFHTKNRQARAPVKDPCPKSKDVGVRSALVLRVYVYCGATSTSYRQHLDWTVECWN
jgi:hypothetical protein